MEDSLRLARPGASLEDIEKALVAANAWSFVSKLPKGCGTSVGERGIKLSGGESQRIAIARAVLKDAPILILDEATSSVEVGSEQLIHEALERLATGRTTIAVAHHLSSMMWADEIVMMQDGRIVAQGTHRGLYQTNKLYREFIERQVATSG